jgi:O-antigen/teichoic acid export membrane protein
LLSPWPLPVLACAAVVESMACALLLWRGASRSIGMRPGSLAMPDIANVRVLAGLAWPMLASAFTVAIYSRIDVFMLGRMIGREAAGMYSAATMVSEGFSILPAAVMAAVAPRLTALFATEPARFTQVLHSFVRRLSLLGLLIATVTTLVAPWLVVALLGHDYAPAVPVLQVAIWATWIVFVSVASDPWYINHDLRHLYLAKTSAAAALNIVLNLVLIPRWGTTGAAWATVLAYSASAVAMGAAWPATRPLFRLQLRAMAGLPAAQSPAVSSAQESGNPP